MKESETATQDAEARWNAIGDPAQEQEDGASAAEGDTLPTAEAPTPSPAAADTETEAQPDGSADEGAVEAQPPGDAEPDPAAPSDAGKNASEAPKQNWQPWKPKADGRELSIPGAIVTDGWLAIPAESIGTLQAHLADRSTWIEERKRLQQQIDAKSEGDSEAEVRAQALLEHFGSLMEQGPEAMLKWFQGFDANMPLLQKELELATFRAKDGARKRQEEAGQREARTKQYEEWKPGALKGAIEDLLTRPEFKDAGLDPEKLYRKFAAWGDAAFTQLSEDAPQIGLRKGAYIPRYDVLFETMTADAEMLRSVRQGVQTTQAAKQQNKAAVSPSKAPPAVSAKGSPSPGGKTKPAPKNKEEWEEQLFGKS